MSPHIKLMCGYEHSTQKHQNKYDSHTYTKPGCVRWRWWTMVTPGRVYTIKTMPAMNGHIRHKHVNKMLMMKSKGCVECLHLTGQIEKKNRLCVCRSVAIAPHAQCCNLVFVHEWTLDTQSRSYHYGRAPVTPNIIDNHIHLILYIYISLFVNVI